MDSLKSGSVGLSLMDVVLAAHRLEKFLEVKRRENFKTNGLAQLHQHYLIPSSSVSMSHHSRRRPDYAHIVRMQV